MYSDTPVESSSLTAVVDTEKRDEKAAGIQTVELETSNKGSQTVLSNDSQSQTNAGDYNAEPSCDMEKLATFLKRIYPAILSELKDTEEISKNAATNEVAKEESSIAKYRVGKIITYLGKAVSSISWNSTRKLLAIAYCESVVYESWCTHEGIVNIYDTFDGACAAHTYTKGTSSCPKSISFHPTKPNVLAAGLANGNLVLWDLDGEDYTVSQKDKELKHTDNINTVLWSKDGRCCITAGKDGRIIFWTIQGNDLNGTSGYFIKSVYCSAELSCKEQSAEILSVDFWWQDKNQEFVVAAAGGTVLHCSTSETVEVSSMMPQYLDPVVMNYEPHSGIITDVRCNGDDTFATCGINSEIHVYKRKIATPIHIIHTDFALLGIEWIGNPVEMIACWGSSPKIYFYDVGTYEKLDYNLSGSEADSVITSASFAKSRFVVAGTRKGTTILWSAS
ncbi:UNVERIFIED_CONTAM: hypothetical protein PYX00_007409 [Menopon gallinae]|uniref:IFT140 first beta-propeller domain-containing protein n=1 Tax=Menopon gallinae TaxID=328185 RepID=A0AAW2HJ52_9NEOP